MEPQAKRAKLAELAAAAAPGAPADAPPAAPSEIVPSAAVLAAVSGAAVPAADPTPAPATAPPAPVHASVEPSAEGVQPQVPVSASPAPAQPLAALAARGPVVDSSDVLQSVAHFERRCVGSVDYVPGMLLALGRELALNCVLQVRVSYEYLEDFEIDVARRELWGTDVYTDDSDLVYVLHHVQRLPLPPGTQGDLLVDLLLLPTLKRYAGCSRGGLYSRSWLSQHDGISYMVLNARVMPRGWSQRVPAALPQRLLAHAVKDALLV